MIVPVPFLTIIIPSLNQPQLMEASIRSIIEQGSPTVQCLIADCGLNEETRFSIRQYSDHVNIVAQEGAGTWQDAVSAAVTHCVGHAFSWLTPGDTFLEGVFDKVARIFQSEPDIGVLFGGAEQERRNSGQLEIRRPGDFAAGWFGQWPETWLPPSSAFIRLSAWQQCGPLESKWAGASDLDLWLRMAHRYPILAIEEILCRMKEPPFSNYLRFVIDTAMVLEHHGMPTVARRHLLAIVDEYRQLECESQVKLCETEQRVDSLLNSLSWRVTAPLRALDQVIRNIPLPSRELKRHIHPQHRVTVVNEPWPQDTPLVSVVIPCYNYGEYVEVAVDSVLAQTFQDFEIIVVEGGSTDRFTIRVVQELKKPKTTVYFRPTPKFPGDNRNYGIERARGKYICCLDADDLLMPTYLEKALFVAETYHADIVYPSLQCFCGHNQIWRSGEASFPEIVERNPLSIVSLFRREAWCTVGGFRDWGARDEHVPEDWDFWVRLLGHGYRAVRIPEPLMRYRIHGQGVTASHRVPTSRQSAVIRKSNSSLFTRENIDVVVQKLAISYEVQNPWCNMRSTCTDPHVLFILKTLPRKDEINLFIPTLQELSKKGVNTSIVVIGAAETENNDTFAAIASYTQRIYTLQQLLENSEKWGDFIGYLLDAYSISYVFISNLVAIQNIADRKHPHLKIVKANCTDIISCEYVMRNIQ